MGRVDLPQVMETGVHLAIKSLGTGALQNNTTGDFNTAIGVNALFRNTTASNNTAIGADVSGVNLTNATAIGNGAIVNASNSVWHVQELKEIPQEGA